MVKRKLWLVDDSSSSSNIDILLDADVCQNLIYGERILINKQLSALKCAFGWLIVDTDSNGSNFPENMTIVNNAISNDLRLFWEIEEFPDETKNLSEKDSQLIQNFENSLKFNKECFFCKLIKTYEFFVSLIISCASVGYLDEKIREFMVKRKLWLVDDSSSSSNIDILLDADVCQNLIYGERILINKQLSALKCAFGWLIVDTDSNGSNFPENMTIVNNAISNDLRLFWEIEEFPDETKNLSEKDSQLIQNFENSLKFNKECFFCKLIMGMIIWDPLLVCTLIIRKLVGALIH